jgi:hypothetical protein
MPRSTTRPSSSTSTWSALRMVLKRGKNPIYKPLVIYQEDRLTSEEMDTSDLKVLITEGTYTYLLRFADFRVFIRLWQQ